MSSGGAQPQLVPVCASLPVVRDLPVSHSFRFTTVGMRSLADDLRAGRGVTVQPTSTADVDVVLASEWKLLERPMLEFSPVIWSGRQPDRRRNRVAPRPSCQCTFRPPRDLRARGDDAAGPRSGRREGRWHGTAAARPGDTGRCHTAGIFGGNPTAQGGPARTGKSSSVAGAPSRRRSRTARTPPCPGNTTEQRRMHPWHDDPPGKGEGVGRRGCPAQALHKSIGYATAWRRAVPKTALCTSP